VHALPVTAIHFVVRRLLSPRRFFLKIADG
jgi:hypothetical protein